jgi:hypothetical protein
MQLEKHIPGGAKKGGAQYLIDSFTIFSRRTISVNDRKNPTV